MTLAPHSQLIEQAINPYSDSKILNCHLPEGGEPFLCIEVFTQN